MPDSRATLSSLEQSMQEFEDNLRNSNRLMMQELRRIKRMQCREQINHLRFLRRPT